MKLIYRGVEKERLDKFLHGKYPERSRSKIQHWIENSGATVNGTVAAVHHWLKNGDVIEIANTAEQVLPHRTPQEHAAPTMLYHDEEFAIIIKPAGMLTHPTDHDEKDTLAAWITEQFPDSIGIGDDPKRPGIVHRLDRDVSGLMLIALTKESYNYFKQLFSLHQIEKRYQCLVHGSINQTEGTITVPIDRDKKRGRMVAQSGKIAGKEAITLYTVLERFNIYTLLDVQIVTGRTHQIRAHLFSIGHSIVGDPLYRTKDIRKKKHQSFDSAIPLLFAYHLGFQDRHGQKHDFTVELPDYFTNVLQQLRTA